MAAGGGGMTSSEVEQTPPPPGPHPNFCWEFGTYSLRTQALGGGRTGRHLRGDKVRRAAWRGLNRRAVGSAGEMRLEIAGEAPTVLRERRASSASYALRRGPPGDSAEPRAVVRTASFWASLASVSLAAREGCRRSSGIFE